jgi:hypothetical protein
MKATTGRSVPAWAACLLAVALTGCTVEQTEEARPPEVDVDVDPGRWPDYKVNWADVDVGTSERTITVPVVRIEKETRTVSVPYIDITPPGVGQREERLVSIDVDVPHGGYELQITEIRASRDDLWVVGHLRETSASSTPQPTRVADQVMINAPGDLDVRTIIVGQRPDGVDNQEHRFVGSAGDLQQIVPTQARVIYERKSAASTGKP